MEAIAVKANKENPLPKKESGRGFPQRLELAAAVLIGEGTHKSGTKFLENSVPLTVTFYAVQAKVGLASLPLLRLHLDK